MKKIPLVFLAAISITGCAKHWDEQDDTQCKRMGMIGPYYMQCRQMLSNNRSAAFAQISSGLNQVGQATAPRPFAAPPCLGSSSCYRRDDDY